MSIFIELSGTVFRCSSKDAFKPILINTRQEPVEVVRIELQGGVISLIAWTILVWRLFLRVDLLATLSLLVFEIYRVKRITHVLLQIVSITN